MTTLVWDASALHHPARADRLDVLCELARGERQNPWQHVTTAAVLDELSAHSLNVSNLGWLDTIHVDGIDELQVLVTWMQRVGATSDPHRGEVTVFAWAETHQAIAIVDDRSARRAAQRSNTVSRRTGRSGSWRRASSTVTSPWTVHRIWPTRCSSTGPVTLLRSAASGAGRPVRGSCPSDARTDQGRHHAVTSRGTWSRARGAVRSTPSGPSSA